MIASLAWNMRCRFGIAGLSAKKSSSLSGGALPSKRQRIVAAQRHPIRIADRRDGGEPVERAAQNDGEEARIAAFGMREPRQMRPGEQRAGGQQQFAARRGVEHRHGFISAKIPAS